jgi:hypothetical protein
MNKLRCQPGDRCIIIGDVRGCDCNIGATLTVTHLAPPVEGMPPAWLFCDVSRPIKIVDLDRRGNPIPAPRLFHRQPATATRHARCLRSPPDAAARRRRAEIDTAAQEKAVTA